MEVSSIGRRIFTAVPSTRQVRVGRIAHVGDAPAQNSHLGDKSSMFTCSSSHFKKNNQKREKRADLKVTVPLLQKQGSPWVTCPDRDPENQIMLTHCGLICSMCRVPDLYKKQHLYIQRIHQSREICRLHTRPKGHQWAPWAPPWPCQHSFASADKLDPLQTFFFLIEYQINLNVTHLTLHLNVCYTAFGILMAMNEKGLSLLVWQQSLPWSHKYYQQQKLIFQIFL